MIRLRNYNNDGNIFIFVVTCSANKPYIICFINHCDHQICPQYPEAQCRVDRCDQYKIIFFINQDDITDHCHTSIIKHCLNYFTCLSI